MVPLEVFSTRCVVPGFSSPFGLSFRAQRGTCFFGLSKNFLRRSKLRLYAMSWSPERSAGATCTPSVTNFIRSDLLFPDLLLLIRKNQTQPFDYAQGFGALRLRAR